jgi:histidyl-tRNA synthetase
MKAQMKAANRSGAAIAVIVGTDETEAGVAVVRPMHGDTGRSETAQFTVERAALVTSIHTRISESSR